MNAMNSFNSFMESSIPIIFGFIIISVGLLIEVKLILGFLKKEDDAIRLCLYSIFFLLGTLDLLAFYFHKDELVSFLNNVLLIYVLLAIATLVLVSLCAAYFEEKQIERFSKQHHPTCGLVKEYFREADQDCFVTMECKEGSLIYEAVYEIEEKDYQTHARGSKINISPQWELSDVKILSETDIVQN